jgi:hypothetical protein
MKARGFQCIGRLLALWLSLNAATALACGYCVEDRIAAVYDHALVRQTVARKHQLAFFAWDGPMPRSDAARLKIVELAQAVPGVDKGSARVSMEPAAIAVAFDPRRDSVQSITTALQNKLRGLKLSVVPLRAAQL